MEHFVAIAAGLDVAPSLAALAALDPVLWVDLMGDGGRYVPMLGADKRRRHEAALAPVWALVDQAHERAAAGHGDAGELAYVRVGRMPPGARVLPHADGMDGVSARRYQIVLQAAPGGAITLGGETRCLAAGEVWQLDVAKLHNVENGSDRDRIVVVFDSRAAMARARFGRVENFVKIAEGLDVGPALAEIAEASDCWIHVNADTLQFIMLISGPFERQLEAQLPESWRLIDQVLAILAADPDHRGALRSARIGRIPPGAFMPVHQDGIDGISWRRYQIALQSEPGVLFTVDGEAKRFLPGECWQFHAGRMHMVRNDSDADRITILIDTIA